MNITFSYPSSWEWVAWDCQDCVEGSSGELGKRIQTFSTVDLDHFCPKFLDHFWTSPERDWRRDQKMQFSCCWGRWHFLLFSCTFLCGMGWQREPCSHCGIHIVCLPLDSYPEALNVLQTFQPFHYTPLFLHPCPSLRKNLELSIRFQILHGFRSKILVGQRCIFRHLWRAAGTLKHWCGLNK